jgi:hypothetical protein
MSPFYDLLFVGHIASAVVGFGAVGVAGLSASKAGRSADPFVDEALSRFFRPGVDWPARVIFLVPVLGLAVLFGADRSDVRDAWPWIGLGLWLVIAGVATGSCWPCERRAQEAFAAQDVDVLRQACRRMETSVGVISVCALLAFVVMIVQP